MGYQMRVLVIEDSQVLRRLVETCFRDFDFEFEFQRLPHSPQRIGGFDKSGLVIIGMYQPFAIGLGIIRRLAARQESPAIVAMTTDTREKSVAAVLEAGADAVIKMPFRPDELREAVTQALDQRQMH
ncbi:MAG: response regulator [Acidimicrobiia bacterium]|nr:response regulator [Acidimicrobiia bacterium]